MIEIPERPVAPKPQKAIGMDVGLISLLALSDGTTVENPYWLRTSLAKLRVLQRKASRRIKEIHRRSKAYQQVAKLHEKIANQRCDLLHKVTRALVSEYSLIGIEDLRLAFMNRNKNLSLSSHDAGLGAFRQQLEYKAKEAGTLVIAVNAAYTSQACSGCGSMVKKDLSVRVHACPDCGLILDRDVNAAINILTLALQKPPGRGGQDVTWVVGNTERVLRS